MNRILLPLAAWTCMALTGCGGSKTESQSTSQPTATAYSQHIDQASAGTISGKVTFSGPKPVRRAIDMSANPLCAHNANATYEDVVVSDTGGLKNVFVWLKTGVPEGTWAPPATPVVLDQKGCMYEPHVLGLMVNQELKILNDDPTNHNVHPLPRVNQEWNESQPSGSGAILKRFSRQEVMLPIKCNVHPWMRAFVGVVSHPFFAVTGADGVFKISGVPPGQYTVEAWQEKFGIKDIAVTVPPKGSETANFTYTGRSR